MKTPGTPERESSKLDAVHLMQRVRSEAARRAGDERRVAKKKREDDRHLSAEEAVKLGRNVDAMLRKRDGQLRMGELCEKAFGESTSREVYRLRLAEGDDPQKKQLRRWIDRYRDLAKGVADMTGEPRRKVLRELVIGTRFDEIEAMAEWDRIDTVAGLLRRLVTRLDEEFGWSALYRRTAQLRRTYGGKLTWPLYSEDYYKPQGKAEQEKTERYGRKLQASLDPFRMYYAGLDPSAYSGVAGHYFENDQLQDDRFFFVPHARVGYVVAWDLPKRSEDPLGYQLARERAIAWERKEPDGMNEPELDWDAERLEPRGHVDGGARIYCGSTTQSYVWLVAYPSPLGNGVVVPALYRPGEETGAWLMPLDSSTLAAVQDGIWLDRESDTTLIERLEVLLGADQTDGICPLERDLRFTGTWLAHNPVLAWEARQRERHRNMLDRARDGDRT